LKIYSIKSKTVKSKQGAKAPDEGFRLFVCSWYL